MNTRSSKSPVLTPNQKKKLRAAIIKYVEEIIRSNTTKKAGLRVSCFIKEDGLRGIRALLAEDGILDVTPVAHKIMDRVLDELARLTDPRMKGLTDWQKQSLKLRKSEAMLKLREELATTQSERTRLRKVRRSYEKSLGIRANTTEKGRAAISFLYEFCLSHDWSPERDASLLLSTLAPLVQALRKIDFEFFENLAAEMRFLEASNRGTARARARRARWAITVTAINKAVKHQRAGERLRRCSGLITTDRTKTLGVFSMNADTCGNA